MARGRVSIDSAAFCLACYQQLEEAGMARSIDIENVRARDFMVTFLRFLQDERGAPISAEPLAGRDGRGRRRGIQIQGGVKSLMKKLMALCPEKPFDGSIL